MPDFMPKTDNGFLDWSQNFSDVFVADEAAVGLDPADSAAYATLNDAYHDAYILATNPLTRTPVTIAAKNTAKAAAMFAARALVARMQVFPDITDEIRASLGITIPDAGPSVIGAPSTRPIIQLIDNAGNQQTIKVRDELTPLTQRKPDGVVSAEVWTKVGGTAPASIAECSYQGDLTKNPFSVGFSPGDEGKPVHYITRWKTRRGLVGPEGPVLSSNIAA